MPHRLADKKPLDPEVLALAQARARQPEAALEILSALQTQRGGLTRAAITDTARALYLPAERVYGVASFYSMLNVTEQPAPHKTLRVCDGPVCWLRGATQTRAALEKESNGEWAIERTSCLGLCDRAPAALFDDTQAGPLSSEQPLTQRGAMPDYSQPRPGEVRVMLANTGGVDPDSIDSAMAHGAYAALQKARAQTPEAIVSEVEASGLTGRGGAGFPVGRKWRMVLQSAHARKYVVCNADESEPLIFKDRVLMDTNPHQLIEGLAIAAHAVGAREGFIYIRGEYASQAARLERAIAQAEERGLLQNFHLHVHRGAGAYICGEETALIESLEGKRGEPRIRPPFPAAYGYHGQSTLVNNVETYSAIPAIVANGAPWYRGLSAYPTPGTKLYMVLGHINRPGLFEAPFGLTLRQVIEDFGGGMRPGARFQFALTGGAAGTLVPPALLDVPMDYASAAKGVSLGAGAFLICDESVSPIAFLRELLHFFELESCGKCTPCRLGTRQAREIVDGLAAGAGQSGDAQRLAALADVLQNASFCGLGQSVAVPLKSALKCFSELFNQ